MPTPAPPAAVLNHCLRSPSGVLMELRHSTLPEGIGRAFEAWSAEAFPTEVDHRACSTAAARVLEEEVQARRCEAWVQGLVAEPLRDAVAIVPDALMPATEFRPFAGVFERGDLWFFLMPTLPSFNSSYWISGVIPKLMKHAEVKVRLDPFAYIPKDSPVPFYKAWMYGPEPSWERLATLRGDLHLQAIPTQPGSEVAFTDIVWSGRSDGTVVLQCEEVPRPEHHRRPARYFHSIYRSQEQTFEHLDGAVRLYTEEELERRLESGHVRKAGKVGVRRKLFVADGAVPRELWAEAFAAFFFWNDDISRYVTALSSKDEPGIYEMGASDP